MGLLVRSFGKLVSNMDSIEEYARDWHCLNANVAFQGHALLFIAFPEGCRSLSAVRD
jgi:hypothetical protein